MIMIEKDEAMALRNKFGDSLPIAITNRHKRGGRKHYYTEETRRVLSFLKAYHSKEEKGNKE